MKENPVRLVHGVFRTPEMIIGTFLERCKQQGLNVDRFHWYGPMNPPDFDPARPDVAVVLTVMLGTVAETVAFAWEWIQDDQPLAWSWSGIHLDEQHLVFAANAGFRPWTLFWSRVSLDAYVDVCPLSAWNLRCPPGIVALFAAAQHPQRLLAIDNEQRRGFWLTGLMCLVPVGKGREWFSLFLRRNFVYDRVDLDCLRSSEKCNDLAAPRLEHYC